MTRKLTPTLGLDLKPQSATLGVPRRAKSHEVKSRLELRHAMNDTLLRQWTMLACVPRAPRKIDTASLQDQLEVHGFAVDQRSVQRDLRKLSDVFPLVCDDRHRPHGWSWQRDAASAGVPGMDVHTALAFRMADEHLRHLLPEATRDYLAPWFTQAQGILAGVATNSVASWPKKVRAMPVGQPLVPPIVAPEVLEAVHHALAAERQMQVRYRRRGETDIREYTVHPLGLVYRDAVPMLVCTLWSYRDPKQLMLHRMEQVEVLEAPVDPLVGFDLDAWIAERSFDFRMGEGLIQLECLFEAVAAVRIIETPLERDQQCSTMADGRVRLRAAVPDTMQLRHWLRGFGPLVEVVGPPELRADMLDQAQRTVTRYQVES